MTYEGITTGVPEADKLFSLYGEILKKQALHNVERIQPDKTYTPIVPRTILNTKASKLEVRAVELDHTRYANLRINAIGMVMEQMLGVSLDGELPDHRIAVEPLVGSKAENKDIEGILSFPLIFNEAPHWLCAVGYRMYLKDTEVNSGMQIFTDSNGVHKINPSLFLCKDELVGGVTGRFPSHRLYPPPEEDALFLNGRGAQWIQAPASFSTPRQVLSALMHVDTTVEIGL